MDAVSRTSRMDHVHSTRGRRNKKARQSLIDDIANDSDHKSDWDKPILYPGVQRGRFFDETRVPDFVNYAAKQKSGEESKESKDEDTKIPRSNNSVKVTPSMGLALERLSVGSRMNREIYAGEFLEWIRLND